jgi:hypothetical protein
MQALKQPTADHYVVNNCVRVKLMESPIDLNGKNRNSLEVALYTVTHIPAQLTGPSKGAYAEGYSCRALNRE